MKSYVRTKLRFRGDPEDLRSLRDKIAETSGNEAIQLAGILPAGKDEKERLTLWGTVSEAEETDVVLYRNDTILEYSFDTVDNTPEPVLRKLASENPSLDMRVQWAHEDIAPGFCRCGILESAPGTGELTVAEPDNEFELACEVWDRDPDEERLELEINYIEE
ncbi:MAG: hypothetical protein IJ091_07720 [Oscillospiraceae bacterium]|nr:hypothetical protein [Oscillospiraceae bacterium]